MQRTIARWVIGILGLLLIVAGVGLASVVYVIGETLEGGESLNSSAQIIPADACETVLVESSGTRLSAEEFERFTWIAERSAKDLLISIPEGPSVVLVGIADSAAVEERLLGARYCLAQATDGQWSVDVVEIEATAPDVDFAGLTGMWARAEAGETVVLPLPVAGSTLIVTADGPFGLGDVVLTGRYSIAGADRFGTIALYAGVAVAVVGLILVLVGVLGMRRRGRHEAGASSSESSST